eukprot:9272884-Ditylum_brightwellii.AAC.1
MSTYPPVAIVLVLSSRATHAEQKHVVSTTTQNKGTYVENVRASPYGLLLSQRERESKERAAAAGRSL